MDVSHAAQPGDNNNNNQRQQTLDLFNVHGSAALDDAAQSANNPDRRHMTLGDDADDVSRDGRQSQNVERGSRRRNKNKGSRRFDDALFTTSAARATSQPISDSSESPFRAEPAGDQGPIADSEMDYDDEIFDFR